MGKKNNFDSLNYLTDKQYSKKELLNYFINNNLKDNTLSTLSNILKSIIKILRDPDGCPWDKTQTIYSLSEFLLEEVHEAYEAILNNNFIHLKEELGDILSQVYMISRIAEEKNKFSIKEVFEGIIEKLIRRHPHVFGNKSAINDEQALKLWNNEKKKEKIDRVSRLDGVPSTLPALLYALKIQRKASIYGFDWNDFEVSKQIDNIFEKIYEEIDEIKKELDKINFPDRIKCRKNFKNYQVFNEEEISTKSRKSKISDNLEEEVGDLLFSVVNLARKLEINPDFALKRSIKKFIKRFKFIENFVSNKNIDIKELDPEQLDELWIQSKHLK